MSVSQVSFFSESFFPRSALVYQNKVNQGYSHQFICICIYVYAAFLCPRFLLCCWANLLCGNPLIYVFLFVFVFKISNMRTNPNLQHHIRGITGCFCCCCCGCCSWKSLLYLNFSQHGNIEAIYFDSSGDPKATILGILMFPQVGCILPQQLLEHHSQSLIVSISTLSLLLSSRTPSLKQKHTLYLIHLCVPVCLSAYLSISLKHFRIWNGLDKSGEKMAMAM